MRKLDRVIASIQNNSDFPRRPVVNIAVAYSWRRERLHARPLAPRIHYAARRRGGGVAANRSCRADRTSKDIPIVFVQVCGFSWRNELSAQLRSRPGVMPPLGG